MTLKAVVIFILIQLSSVASYAMTCAQAIGSDKVRTESGKQMAPTDALKGPSNLVWTKFMGQKPEQRNPRWANAIQRRKNFPIDLVIMSFFDFRDEYRQVAQYLFPRSPIVPKAAGGYYESGGGAVTWLTRQYPDVFSKVKDWLSNPEIMGQGFRPGDFSRINLEVLKTKYVNPFLEEYKKIYGNEITLIPIPTLTNRVIAPYYIPDTQGIKLDREKLFQMVKVANPYTLEVILGLFSHKYAEENMDAFLNLVKFLSGGQGIRNVSEMKSIISWILTQYPELQALEVLATSAGRPMTEALKYRFGSHLTLVPYRSGQDAWENIDSKLTAVVGTGFAQNELPKILTSLWEQRTREKEKEPMYILNHAGKYAVPKPGDGISVSLKILVDQDGVMSKKVLGKINEFIVDENGNTVGFTLIRKYRKPGDQKTWFETTEPMAIWYHDIEPALSMITDANINFKPSGVRKQSEFDSGLSSGVFLRLATSNFRTPVSVGDEVVIEYGKGKSASGTIVKLLVDQNNVTTNLIVKSESWSTAGEVDIRVSDIVHKDMTRINLKNYTDEENFRLPSSSLRAKPKVKQSGSSQGQVVMLRNSGSIRLPLGSPELPNTKFQASISPGDEILINLSRPNNLFKFSYERLTVKEIVFDENNNPIGFRGETINTDYELSSRVIKFSEIDLNDSHISLSPWSELSNQIPGAFSSRIPYTSKSSRKGFNWEEIKRKFGSGPEQTFSSGQYQTTAAVFPPWTDYPMAKTKWFEVNRLPETDDTRILWATWVLGIKEEKGPGEVTKMARKLMQKFHPDRKASMNTNLTVEQLTEAQQSIGVALEILAPKNRRNQ